MLRRMECAFIEKRIKDDGSPTTMADLAAEELIIRLTATRSGPTCRWSPRRRRAACSPTRFSSSSTPSTAPATSSTARGEYSVNIALDQWQAPLSRPSSRPRPWAGSGLPARRPRRRKSRRRATTASSGAPSARATAPDERSHRSGQSPAWRRRDGSLSVDPFHRHPAHDLVGAQVLPDRFGGGRRLCALRPDHGMGHGCGRSHPHPRRRSGDRPRRHLPSPTGMRIAAI